MYTQETFASGLRPGSPWCVFAYDEVATTMEEVRRIAKEYPDCTHIVVLAEQQYAGLGRYTRKWESQAGGLWLTALVRFGAGAGFCAQEAPLFTYAAALAVYDVLDDMGISVGIKWPNDILVTEGPFGGRKLCGIRCESKLAGSTLDWVSMGIGLNVNQDKFPNELANAVSFRQLDGVVRSRTTCACAILDKLEYYTDCLVQEGFVALREKWLNAALGMGQEVCVHQDVSGDGGFAPIWGTMVGLDDQGRLLLQVGTEKDPKAISAGDLVFEA